MPTSNLWNAPDLVPSIEYADLPRAVEWFELVFGFHERRDARLTWPGGGMTWIEAGSALFNITAADDAGAKTGNDSSSVVSGVKMKVYVDNVDQHFARAKAEGATIISELLDGFWGGRIYRALDREGHQWEISQRGRDLAADRWELPPGLTRGVPK
ncbi:MAG: VOC family protein [Terriglobales bacterium]|jgi:uncharacterized glyoxalase superfamily protein PhnB